MLSGYVNTESNYFMDSQLNALAQLTYEPKSASASSSLHSHCLVDILRVYYEFGPVVCGLVNLVDFTPRFYPSTCASSESNERATSSPEPTNKDNLSDSTGVNHQASSIMLSKIPAFESVTRLVRRSLAWFELECKRVQTETSSEPKPVKLKLCNLQLRHKVFQRRQLIQANASLDSIRSATRRMVHQRLEQAENVIVDSTCQLSDCYQLKYVRLAYVVPVSNGFVRPIRPLRSLSDSAAASSQSSSSSESGSEQEVDEEADEEPTVDRSASQLLSQLEQEEQRAKQAALELVSRTNERHKREQDQQQQDELMESPIGQLTYRMFAPCQLVNSSSCFSINPVNSSSPLARRGSLDLNNAEPTADSAHPSASLLGPGHAHSAGQQIITSFGAFLPAISHDMIAGQESANQQAAAGTKFTSNQFEEVEAIRRRMEVYVTTNCMKVIAGETLLVNLTDALSCLSTAIEQSVVKCSYSQRKPSTWISVQVLYAAVPDLQLPSKLLAHQRLSSINEEAKQVEPVFEEEFRSSAELEKDAQEELAEEATGEQSPMSIYNSAYERTVPLPSQPDTSKGSRETIKSFGFQSDCLWFKEMELVEAQLEHQRLEQRQLHLSGKKRRHRRLMGNSDDSQCSIM